MWTIRVEAETASERGTTSATFRVNNSTSEELLGKYGFWIEAPTLRGITPYLAGRLPYSGGSRFGGDGW